MILTLGIIITQAVKCTAFTLEDGSSMKDFVFCSPTRFVFGKGFTDKTGQQLAIENMRHVLLVYGQGSVVRSGLLDRVKSSLAAAGVTYVEAGGVRPNPEVNWVRAAIETARENNVDGVLAVGGGSTIDASKAVAFGVPYQGDVWDFFSLKIPIDDCLPIAVVLTIPAAGSEASSSCVISNDELKLKVGVNGNAFRPKLAIMDPELTFTLPPFQTAAGVTDMIAHICERYFSGVGAVPISDGFCTTLVNALMDAAPRALEQPDDYEARATIMWAGTLAHNDLVGCGRSLAPMARAGGWESHGLEHELSAHHPEITHGAGLAVIMPAWMRYVWREDPQRFLDFAADVFGMEPVEEDIEPADEAIADVVEAAIDELQAFFRSMGMPARLADFGLGEDDIEPLLDTLAQNKGEIFGCFKQLNRDDARAIYLSAL